MVDYAVLIGAHAFLGEFGALAFLWTFVEMLDPSDSSRLGRAKIASALGVIFLVLAWLVGGYAYLSGYGPNVKPVILHGPLPWAHAVFTETKEHVFLFLPFLALAACATIWGNARKFVKGPKASQLRFAVLLLSGVVILLAFAMAGMGYVISTGARQALEAAAR